MKTRFSHIIQQVFCEPWLIKAAMHHQIQEIVKAHFDGSAHLPGGIVEQMPMDDDHDDDDCPMHELRDRVAIIPVSGVIGKRIGMFERMSGMVDVDDIMELLNWADDDQEVDGVVLHFDSPGGTVTGVPEIGNRIRSMTKPVIGFSDTQCCSGAYWMASQCDAIYGTESSCWGSIGVYLQLLDESRLYAAKGLDVKVVKAGRYKGTGIPGTQVTEEQLAQLQSRVDGLYKNFVATVTAGRGAVEMDTMQGQDFYCVDAVARRLVDSIGTLNQAIADVKYLAMKGKKQ